MDKEQNCYNVLMGFITTQYKAKVPYEEEKEKKTAIYRMDCKEKKRSNKHAMLDRFFTK